jgi:hypothetical protein
MDEISFIGNYPKLKIKISAKCKTKSRITNPELDMKFKLI